MTHEIQATATKPETLSKKDKKKAEEQKAKLEAEQRAKTIYQQAKEQGISFYQAALKASTSRSSMDVRSDIKDDLEKMHELGLISDKEYKAARKEGGIGFWRRHFGCKNDEKAAKEFKAQANANQKEMDDKTEAAYLKAMASSTATTAKGVRKDAQAAIAKDETLTADEKKNAQKQLKRGNWFRQLAEWTGDVQAKDAVLDARTQAAVNKRNTYQTEFAEGKRTLSKDAKATMEKLGLTFDQLYEIGDDTFGSDATDNYSHYSKNGKGTQRGENNNIIANLQVKTGKAGLQDSKKDIEKLYEELGYDVEAKIKAGHVVGGAIKGATLGASGFCQVVKQSQTALGVNGIVDQTQKVVPVGILTTAVGAVAGAGVAAHKDAHRVEDSIYDKEGFKNVKTYEELVLYADGGKNKKAADILKKIGKLYTNEDGTLKTEQMAEALNKAAGNDDLNYQEARKLYADILGNKVKIEEENNEEINNEENHEEEACEPVDLDPEVKDITIDDTSCHEIHAGDTWSGIVIAKYQPKTKADHNAIVRQLKDAYFEAHKEELAKIGITSSKQNFFPSVYKKDENGRIVRDSQGNKVHNELCIPTSIIVNGNEYGFDASKKVKAVAVDPNARGSKSFATTSNPFLKHSQETTYRSQGCDNQIYTSKESQADAHEKAKAAKK